MPADDRTRITRSRCSYARVVAVVGTFVIIGLCPGVVPNAAAQPYKDRRVVEVLRDFQRQGVRVIFSTALVTPDMRVGEEPHGDDPQDVIIEILAPHDLTLRVGLRGILLVVRATSVVDPNAGGRAAANATTGAIAGTVRDRATRRPLSAATVRVEGTGLNGLTRDLDGFVCRWYRPALERSSSSRRATNRSHPQSPCRQVVLPRCCWKSCEYNPMVAL